ncbi:MAG: hypothetical protein C0391_03915 [Anaerolinea sp.]|nr:hypothetical protein [Anaerolinea sp.]
MLLKFVGKSWIPNIPARDLTDEEVKKFGEEYLVKTGLYIRVKEESRAKADEINLKVEKEK